jgi:hypothetical protein
MGYNFNAAMGQGAGAYLTLASLLAAASGTAMYKFQKGRSKSKLLEDAIKRRAMARASAHPPDVFLHPVSAHLRNGELEEDQMIDPTGNAAV